MYRYMQLHAIHGQMELCCLPDVAMHPYSSFEGLEENMFSPCLRIINGNMDRKQQITYIQRNPHCVSIKLC